MINKTDEQWKKELTPDQYSILRGKNTEAPFSGIYDDFYQKGIYKCAACGQKLFSSDVKFDAACGWPSFWEAIDKSALILQPDLSHFMVRTEVLCSNCGGHLGHVFDDGPAPTGKRFCINSGALKWEAE